MSDEFDGEDYPILADRGRGPYRWLDALEETMKEELPSLDRLTRAVLTRRRELTSLVTEALVRRSQAQAQGQKNAP